MPLPGDQAEPVRLRPRDAEFAEALGDLRVHRRHGVLEGRVLVSLPTMLVAFARYSRDGSFAVLGANIRFTTIMASDSIAGAVLGGLLLGMFPNLVLIPLPAVILLVVAVKLARHD
ncbi:hypothetical protein OG250_00990 [Streptomyces sp. NBC_00487]|uniref:hypothetical protein n=1 Tax=unclassified Streptomyces TaxID=2593676 RepID=UPI002E183EA3|nr:MULTISPECIES: hypothetical protein [unclassified Streptomyces]